MTRRGRIAVAVWLALVAVCIVLVGRASFTADLSAFLPRAPTAEQQLLVDQLKSGIGSRLILIGIEGGSAAQRAQASQALAARLRTDPQFLHTANGETIGLDHDRQLLFDNRYLLSPAVSPERFSVEGLELAVADSIDLLATSTGLLEKALLPHDPTGEFMQILDAIGGASQPNVIDGVWASRDGARALLLARTRAEGSDTDGQERAVEAIRAAFQASAPAGLQLVLTGPGPFSVEARATIKSEVAMLSGLGTLIIISLLLAVYRSPTALLLGLLPVLTGALAGAAAVSLGFGTIHGATLGFGIALMGEAVDYAIYLLMQSERASAASGQAPSNWVGTFWPTIRLGVLTSVFGFASLLFSGFPGLAQLGLFAIAGLATAAIVTRFVLPHLLPSTLRIRDVSAFGTRLQGGLPALSRLRWPLIGLFLAAIVVLATQREGMWNEELAALSPVPAADQAVDMAMRADLGAPDVGYMVVVSAAGAQAALAASEQVGQQLQGLVEAGVIQGFESPATYLPSITTQQQRLASLPEAVELRRRFQAALAELPVRAERFEPFLADVAAARQRAPLTRADIEGSTLAQGVDALLTETNGHWTALLPLRALPDADQRIDADTVRAALAATGLVGVYFIDIKRESDRLYADYLQEALLLSLAGLVAIVGLLLFATRSPARVLRISLPLVMAVAVVVAGLVLAGQPLIILHLVGMLLIVAVGSNYALFFDRAAAEGHIAPRTLASMLLAVTTTVAGFGLLGLSSVPVLNAIGMTVGPGALLALLFSAILARRP
ncbi:MAG: MMPL family transporter [Thiobacillus sp.]|uniref:MMPL family transporter n=1 Tax=Thiobacillus sp. TaxID=924 RepID=UPI002735EC29|nr:MMPL family transporter [Thiobacillus sp.]MDP3585900.1 MMPL family transporter [Thiobacillus sp.]